MKEILRAFKKIAEIEGMSLSKLEEELGASKGVFSGAYKNDTTINLKWVVALVERYPQYDANWILTQKGSVRRDGVPTDSFDKMLDNKIDNRLENFIPFLKESILTDMEAEMSKMEKRIKKTKSSDS